MTLVSVVGDFYSSVIPVFYHYKDKIKKHIILSDDSKRDSVCAENFKIGIENFCKKYGLKIDNEIISIDEDSVSSLDKAIKKIPKASYINTTDGLSFINSYLSLKMVPSGAKIISYDIFDNDFLIFEKTGFQKNKIKISVPIEDFFLLRNIDVIQKGDKNFARQYEKEIKSIFERYHNEYLGFKVEMTKNSRLPSAQCYPNIYNLLRKMNLKINFNDLFQFLTGTLFEYYVYLILKETGFDDIEIGVKIKYSNVENEFDLLVMDENHLHIVECKHKFFRTLNLSDLVYKYHSLRNILDYDAKAVIVSLVKKYDKNFINRALNYNIGLFDMKHIKNIKRFLKNGEYDIETFVLK